VNIDVFHPERRLDLKGTYIKCKVGGNFVVIRRRQESEAAARRQIACRRFVSETRKGARRRNSGR
jgi:hypothetical protein